MSWAMTEQNSFFGSYETTAPSLTDLFTKHKNEIMIRDVVVTELSGDLAMRVGLDLTSSTATPEAELTGTFNFSDADSLIADIYVPSGTATNVKLLWVMKFSNDWVWSPSTVSFTPTTTGEWVHYAVAISSFKSSVTSKTLNLADIKQILIQFIPKSSTYKGAVLIDNVRSKKGTTETVIADFNKTGSSWAEYEVGTEDNIQISLAQKPNGTTINTTHVKKTGNDLNVHAAGKKLTIVTNSVNYAQVRIYDLTGKVVITRNVIGFSGNTAQIDCSNLVSGNYLFEISQGSKRQVSQVLLP